MSILQKSHPAKIDGEELAALLESDESARVELTERVGDIMESVSVLTRTRLLSSWVTSASARVRLLAARALQRPFVVLGAASALDLLRRDESPDVRTAANIAAVVRRMPVG